MLRKAIRQKNISARSGHFFTPSAVPLAPTPPDRPAMPGSGAAQYGEGATGLPSSYGVSGVRAVGRT